MRGFRLSLAESSRVVPGDDPLYLGVVHLRAIGRDRDEGVIAPKAMVTGGLDGGKDVANRRQTQMREAVDQARIEASCG